MTEYMKPDLYYIFQVARSSCTIIQEALSVGSFKGSQVQKTNFPSFRESYQKDKRIERNLKFLTMQSHRNKTISAGHCFCFTPS